MLDPAIHRLRRERLQREVSGPILLMGNGTRARNLPMNHLPFRQDSTFLYFLGYAGPDAAALIEDGETTLFLPIPGDDDELWHGPTPSPEQVGAGLGIRDVRDIATLDTHLAGRTVKSLAVADATANRRAAAWAGPLVFGRTYGDPELVASVIGMRRNKSEAELTEMRRAAAISARAHRAAMAATRPGESERALAVLFEAVLGLHGAVPGYGTILTRRGEVLHNHGHDGVLESGDLLLLDGGGEVDTGYGVDITRTWPVSGTFSGRQRAAYDAVLEAELASIALCTIGRRYKEVHDASSRVLAQFLIDEGLAHGSVDTIVASGAQALFFPHGVGHHLGMDVHDLENFGDLPSYPSGRGRPNQFGTENLRLDLPLEAGWVVTIEPGFYVVPAILRDGTLRERFAGQVDFDKAEAWLGFGGIRIEDDIHVSHDGPEVLTYAVPKKPEEVESLVGTAPPIATRLC
ncbi:MAG: aminopeptidase P N-terminal domain-containing protein [Proteobacteria bacterium]|nr:aminopeptidase P N-terminal domain-containing protein [Pseudomonadota bacterium]